MNRRALALLLGGLLLAASVAAAVVMLEPPRVSLTRSAEDVDHVTLYQNGLAFIEVMRDFQSPGGESLLVLPLPATARLDSVRIEGGDIAVKQVRASLANDASLRPGDAVDVYAQDGATFRGTFAGFQDGQLVLATDKGVILVASEKVVAVEVAGREQRDLAPGTQELVVLIDAPAGARSVRVSYLAQGPGWTPSHVLDVTTGNLEFYATLTGLDDWKNITLDLVSGSPHVVLTPQPPMPHATVRFAAGLSADKAESSDSIGPGVPLGELHRYRYAHPIDVGRGESVRLLVEQGNVEVLRRAHDVEANTGWGGEQGTRQNAQVMERLEFRNALDEPLPPGRLLAYQDGAWIGEDMLEATPRGERSNVTLALSEQVSARVVLERVETAGPVDRFTYALVVKNAKPDARVDVRASLTYPTHRTTLLSAEPTPSESMGGRVTWDATLGPGESVALRIRYETTRT